MDMKIPEYEFLKDKNILLLKPSLIHRSQDSIETLRKIIELVAKYGYPNVLGDFRGLEIDFSLWSTIEKSKQWKRLGVSWNVKLAAVFDKLEDGNLMRINTLFSHGFNVTAYTDYDEAIEWLSKT
ncbi:unnamed protein product [marine sediment metagenome]|uniref:STAS/SEC14 domain-containing protein n=1 Tax=marine sediment metagenome TaxID=412755 RepID=X1APV3_9ZZZZ